MTLFKFHCVILVMALLVPSVAQEPRPLPLITEVLFSPNPDSSDIRERRRFIEFDSNTVYTLDGCSLENIDASFRLNFDDVKGLPAYRPGTRVFFTIKQKSTLSTEFKINKGDEPILWVREMELAETDVVGLICDGVIADLVAWGNGVAPDGPLYNSAVDAGAWSAGDFVDTAGETPLLPGNSIGREGKRPPTDTNSSSDWEYPGGVDAIAPTPQRQNIYFARINEVLLKPDPDSRDIKERRKFIEIYRRGNYSFKSCSLVNTLGTFRADLDKIPSSYNWYFVVKEKETLDRDFKYVDSQGILWAREMALGLVDGIALICGDVIVDYVCWGEGGVGPSGSLHDEAVASGEWFGTVRYIQLAPENLGGGYISPGLLNGDTLGRDQSGSDTNTVDDWEFPGGMNARGSTVSAVNDDYPNNIDPITPRINEIMYYPDPESFDLTKRRKFVELYRPRAFIDEERFGLEGCTIVNSNGSFRIDFDDSFDPDVPLTYPVTPHPYPYVTVKEKATLEKEVKVLRSKGIIWVRSLPIEENDSLAIFCDGNMVDYVAWGGAGADFSNIRLHQTAVEKNQWSGSNDYVATKDLQQGSSFGRDAIGSDTDTVDDWAFPGGVDAEGDATPGSRNGPEDLPTLGPTSGPTPFFTQRPSESQRPSASPSLSMSPSEMLPTSFPVSEPSSSPTRSPTSGPTTVSEPSSPSNAEPLRAALAVPTKSPSSSPTQSPTSSE